MYCALNLLDSSFIWVPLFGWKELSDAFMGLFPCVFASYVEGGLKKSSCVLGWIALFP